MFRKIIAIVTLFSIAMLWMLFMATTPASAGPLGILIFFVLMYITALGVLTFLFYELSAASTRVTRVIKGKAIFERLSFQKAYYYASVGALAPVMIIAMQSVSQIGFYQFLLVLFFVAIAWVYVAKRTT